MNILSVENVSKAYTNHVALDNVSLNVPQGSVYGLLGPNGAGKTTLIRIINHITAPDSGLVTFDGHQLSADDVSHIGYLPEERGLYKKMKVGEQAMFFAQLKGLDRKEAATQLRQWFERLEISDWWNKKVEELSKGMAQKVQFIVTVLHRPKLLIFDEPFSGFDPINAKVLKDEILHLRDEGATVIFSTHNMESVEELCDHITLINRSHNILSGEVDEIRSRYALGRYELLMTSDPSELLAQTEPMLKSHTLTPVDRGRVKLTIALNSDSDLSRFIAAANATGGLKGFKEDIPSINDIFIQAVESSNA